MNNNATQFDMEAFGTALFSDDADKTYAIIDGAACEGLSGRLAEYTPEYFCLFAGELEPDVAACAPHLVELLPDHPFTEWFLANCFGNHWGIFARGSADLRTFRKHFRTFLRVRSPEGKIVYFRYYDPRVFATYLPTCNTQELKFVFGPVTQYLIEDAESETLTRFIQGDSLKKEVVVLKPPGSIRPIVNQS